MKGLFVCRCGPVGPRPAVEAWSRHIPYDLWVLIHRKLVAASGVGANEIETRMITAYRAGQMSDIIEAERRRRLCEPNGATDGRAGQQILPGAADADRLDSDVVESNSDDGDRVRGGRRLRVVWRSDAALN